MLGCDLYQTYQSEVPGLNCWIWSYIATIDSHCFQYDYDFNVGIKHPIGLQTKLCWTMQFMIKGTSE